MCVLIRQAMGVIALLCAAWVFAPMQFAQAQTGPMLPDGPALLSPAESANMILAARESEPVIASADTAATLMLVAVEGEGAEHVFRIAEIGAPSRTLHIQDGAPQFSEVPRDWWSAQWVLRKKDAFFIVSSRWKPGLALGVDKSGKIAALPEGVAGTLWTIRTLVAAPQEPAPAEAAAAEEATIEPTGIEQAGGEQGGAGPATGEPQATDPAPSQPDPTLLLSADLTQAITANLSAVAVEQMDAASRLQAEAVEDGVFRFTSTSGDGLLILNNQNGGLELTAVQPDWWSGQWLAIPVEGKPGRFALQNRWKPEFFLERTGPGALEMVSRGANAAPFPESMQWRVLRGSQIAEARVAAAQESSQEPPPAQEAAAPMPPHSENSGTPAPNPAPPSQSARAEPAPAVQPVPEGEPASILERIHGEWVVNNGNSESVGPWQTYFKLFATDLLGQGETIWLLADAFSWGEELKAVRGGFDLPFGPERRWHVRHNFNLVSLHPFPVERDYINLDISENEHLFELYRLSEREGHRNETGVFFNYLDSDQAKIELGETKPRDLSFKSRDIGIFTTGNFWREDESVRDSGNYYLSLAKGVDVWGASDTFVVRPEADAFPLVIKGRVYAQREFKESSFAIAGSLGFQYADRPTEWHKHFAVGGLNYGSGFPAAEAAGEIGVGGYVEISRRFDLGEAARKPFSPLVLTPYLRGDLATIESLYDDPVDPLEYARDITVASVFAGMRVEAGKWRFDIGYGLPVLGESRFAGADDGRFAFSSSLRW